MIHSLGVSIDLKIFFKFEQIYLSLGQGTVELKLCFSESVCSYKAVGKHSFPGMFRRIV